MAKFLNPYHFIPLSDDEMDRLSREEAAQELLGDDRDAAARRNHHEPSVAGAAPPASHLRHDRFGEDTYSGRIICKLTTQSPCVFGGEQSQPYGKESYRRVENFKIGEDPAIAGSALRGLISSTAEAASNSAMRVAADRPLSIRSEARDPTHHRPMIARVVRSGLDNELFCVRPLTFPPLKFARPAGRENIYEVPRLLRKLARKLTLPVYLDAYDYRQASNPRAVALLRALTSHGVRSYSGETRQFWAMPLHAGNVCLSQDSRKLHVNREVVRETSQGRRLIGQHPTLRKQLIEPVDSLNESLVLEEDIEGQPYDLDTLPGILRILGLQGRAGEMAETKLHELFIPIKNSDYFLADQTDFDLPADEAVEQFHKMADERTEADRSLPFELAGQRRERDGKLRLDDGDLVYVRLKDETDKRGMPIVDSLAISSIWREDAGSVAEFFADEKSREFWPFHPGRKTLSIAEQLFGFVEQKTPHVLKKDGEAEKENSSGSELTSYAGRVRVSHAWHDRRASNVSSAEEAFISGGADDQAYDGYIPLPILASPKPPCPEMYLYDPKNPDRKPERGELASRPRREKLRFLGRKTYLHHRGAIGRIRPGEWETRQQAKYQNTEANKKQKALVRPVKPHQVFWFHIDFDNLRIEELRLLCYALRPSDGFRHKLGMGKPLGLGTVHIEPRAIALIDRLERYRNDALFGGRRYHAVFTEGEPKDWPEHGYERERKDAATRAAGTRYDAIKLSINALRAAWQPPKDIAHALALLGEPGCLPREKIHYPLCKDQAAEREHFKWFMANRDKDQHLKRIGCQTDPEDLPLERLPEKKKKK